ncbi:glutathione S-transferase family protein [Roseovarius azorensis]|uniref:glutathione S-transferase family protein n=1 Tax=Roseovarius azorensis TaxID=1287727 RepID=UPI000ACA4504|nr:glutathione S-transferase family protein [Roseovarius azorensis]
MSHYRLHYAPDNASLIIRLVLEDLGVPYGTVLVDRAARAQRSPGYLALNPNGLIPVLETPDGVMFETGAILLWLVDRHGRLAPGTDAPTRGDFLKWLFFLSNTVHSCLRMTFYPGQYVGGDAGAQAMLRAQMQARFSEYLDMIETRAAPWFAADHASVLDYYLACLMRWRAIYPEGARGGYETRGWPRLHAMLERLEAGAPLRAAIRAEGLGKTPFTAPSWPDPPEGSAI